MKSQNQLFRLQAWQFLEKIKGPISPRTHVILGFSGGADSVCLLELFFQWKEEGKIQEVHPLYVRYPYRSLEELEEELEQNKRICSLKKCFLKIEIASLEGEERFSENWARKKRYEYFKAYTEEIEQKYNQPTFVALGHNLDDSLEWFFMRFCRSSNPCDVWTSISPNYSYSCVSILRPLLHFNREQIRAFVQSCGQKWSEDSSNENLSFERNFIRQKILGPLKKQYPQLEKNWIWRNNFLSQEYGRINRKEIKKEVGHKELVLEQSTEISLSELEKIRLIIYQLSLEKRSSLLGQLEKLKKAYAHKKRGPLTFHEGILCFLFPKKILLISHDSWESLKKKKYKWIFTQELDLSEKLEKIPFPYMVKGPSLDSWEGKILEQYLPSPKNLYFFSWAIKQCQEEKKWFHFLPLIKEKIEKINSRDFKKALNAIEDNVEENVRKRRHILAYLSYKP